MLLKKISFLIVFLTLVLSNYHCFATDTDVLVLKNKKNGKEEIFYEGSRIMLVCNNGTVLSGKFNVGSDSLIVIRHDTIKLKMVKEVKRKALFSKIIGGTFLSIGALPTILGSYGLYTERETSGDAGLSRVIAVYVFTFGVTMEAVGASIYSIKRGFPKDKWDMRLEKKDINESE